MGKTKTTPYDVADYLATPEDCAAYLDARIEESEGDATFIAKALSDIARARAMMQVAQASGRSRGTLYKALSGERSPDFAGIRRVARALGMRLHAVVA